jgi:hypothetical protein
MLPPVLLIVFNRLDLVKKQVELLRKLPLHKLFVVADGPRIEKKEEDKCNQVRRLIDSANWQCKVYKDYATTNMGCANRIVSGISWVLEQVDRAVILEDDCLADPSMFRYCSELLERYKDDDRIMQICGTQPFREIKSSTSYLFSRHVSGWGWATWSRAWRYFDIQIKISNEEKQRLLEKYLFHNEDAIAYWKNAIEMTITKKIDAWDYPWQLCVWKKNGIAIFPRQNLVKNVGFRKDATHTCDETSKWANIPVYGLSFPLIHPLSVDIDEQFDKRFVHSVFGKDKANDKKVSMSAKILAKAKKIFHKGNL